LKHLEDTQPEEAPLTYEKPDKVTATRVVMLNLLAELLSDYSVEEMRLINFNIPLQSIKSYLESNFF